MTAQLSDTKSFSPQWKRPEEATAFWFRDIMHNPAPITPMNATFFQPAFSKGASRAIAQLSMPITELTAAVHHGYVYLNGKPFHGEQEAAAARFGEMQRMTMELGATVLKDWRETFEPRVLDLATEIQSFDYAKSSTRDIARYIMKFDEMMAEVWEIHMRVNIPPMNAVFGFEEMLGNTLGPGAVDEGRRLLQGFDNKSLQLGQALWDFGRWVRGQRELADAVLKSRVRSGKVELTACPQAEEFKARWQRFLDAYGWRSDVFMEVGHKSWREDPSSPLTQLKGFISKEDADSPYSAHVNQNAERARLERELAEKLPENVRPIYQALLPLVQQYVPIAEDHNFTIDQKYTVVTRQGFMELGSRLVAEGRLREPEDVFYLEYEEIGSVADGNTQADFKRLVRQRQQTRVAQSQLRPPPSIGTPPPADMPPDPLVTKFFGFGAAQSEDPKIVSGYPCSAGTASGTARIVLSLDQADKLRAGDILVCPMTMPAWTPLFGHVAAVVSDSGGPLSHCAIVAREYRIPCVAGTIVGTHTIPDGAHVQVDGSTGVVRILD